MDARRARWLGAATAALATALLFGDQLLAVAPRLWPPGGPRWATLALLVALSVTTPLIVGALLAERYLSE